MAALRVLALRRRADRLARKTCRQHFVVAFGGRVRVIGKPAFKSMRQKGVFPPGFTAESLKRIALYHTPGRAALHFRKSTKSTKFLSNDQKRV